VGLDKPITVTGVVVIGDDKDNYTLTQPTGVTADIGARTLTLTAVPDSKTYDGTTSSDEAPLTEGLQDDDTVTGLTQRFSNKNAEPSGKVIGITPGYTVNDGNGGNNYSVETVTDTTGSIAKRDLTITAVTDTKVYNGTVVSLATPSVVGLQTGDTVTDRVQQFDTRHAGTGKTLSVMGYTVNDGNLGANYTTSTDDVHTGVITAKTLTITAVADTKVYDGDASSDGVPTVSGLVVITPPTAYSQGKGSTTIGVSDSVTDLLQVFDDKNVGTGKTMSVDGYTVNDGNGGLDYDVHLVDNVHGVITAFGVTVTADNRMKPHGDVVTFAGTEFTHTPLLGTDDVTGVTLTSAGSGAGAAIGLYDIVPSDATGTGLSNYAITYDAGTLEVVVVQMGSGGSGTVEGIGEGAVLTVPDNVGDIPGVGSVVINGHGFTVIPEPGFVGIVDIPITVTENGASTVVHAFVTFGIGDPTDVTYGPSSIGTTRVHWTGTPDALGYRVYVGGVLVGTTGPAATEFSILRLLGPNAIVEVQAFGAGESSSAMVRARYVPGPVITLGRVTFFGDSARLKPSTKAKLRKYAALVAAQGFNALTIQGRTERNHPGSLKWRLKLSAARSKAVKAYLAHLFSKHYHVSVMIGTANSRGTGASSSIKWRRAEINLTELTLFDR
jgi:hypothetical protein